MNTYQYLIDGAVEQDGQILYGFRIRDEILFSDKKANEILNDIVKKGYNKITIRIAPYVEFAKDVENAHLLIKRRRVLVTGEKI